MNQNEVTPEADRLIEWLRREGVTLWRTRRRHIEQNLFSIAIGLVICALAIGVDVPALAWLAGFAVLLLVGMLLVDSLRITRKINNLDEQMRLLDPDVLPISKWREDMERKTLAMMDQHTQIDPEKK